MNTPERIAGDTAAVGASRWTDRLPVGGSGLVDYQDSISAQFYELEREAVFRRNWLMVGRDTTLTAAGSYFTKELEVLQTSLLVVRGKDARIRCFHNVCPHRGNKLVWQGAPRQEVQGRCLLFRCKYHGLGFDLDGAVRVLADPESWSGNQGRDLHLAEVPTEVWNGFVFVNLTPGGPRHSLREHLGEFYWHGFDDYPFANFTQRVSLRATAQGNWKLLLDAFSEGFHVFGLHTPFFPPSFGTTAGGPPKFRALHYDLHGKHRSSLAGRIPEGVFGYRIEAAAQATGGGPRYPMSMDMPPLPPAANPVAAGDWGTSLQALWPNWMFQIFYPGWFMTFNLWPLAYNETRFEVDWYLAPPRNFSELWSQQVSLSLFMDAALQDVSTLGATQLGLESNAFAHYPLSDEEVLVRHLHRTVREEVAAFTQAGR